MKLFSAISGTLRNIAAMTSGTKRLLIGVVALLLLAGVALVFIYEPPTKHGRLFKLMDQLESGSTDRGIKWSSDRPHSPKQLSAAESIRALGTNTVPILLAEISVQQSPSKMAIFLKGGFSWLVQKITGKSANLFSSNKVTEAQRRRWKAALALECLGPVVAPQVVPAISPFMNQVGMDSRCKDAAFVLANMGPQGISVLTNCIATKTKLGGNWPQLCAIWALGQHREAATPDWVPLFIDAALSDTNSGQYSSFRYAVPWALGEIKLNEEQSISYLTNLLADPFPFGHSMAATALGSFGEKAKSAIPLLESKLNEVETSGSAREALKAIDPNWKPK